MARSTLFGSLFNKTNSPIIIGFILGSLICVFLIPHLPLSDNSECSKSIMKKDSTNSLNGFPSPVDRDSLRQSPSRRRSSTTSSQKPVVKLNRPRFYATELGVKDKLFVGVVTSKERLHTFATAINKTVAHHVSKLVFFVDSPTSDTQQLPRFLNLVSIGTETPENLKPLVILNYIAGRGQAFANNYDWFFFMPDSVYLKAFKLFELVSHISFGYNVQIGRILMKNSMGNQSTTSPYCDFNAGILLSFGLMRSIMADLRQCMKHVDPTLTASENFGRCILHADDAATCSEEWNGKIYRSWPLSKTASIADDLQEFSKHDSFNSALTVFPIASTSDIFHLHKYYCNQEVDQIGQLIAATEQNLLASTSSNEATESFSWPPGLLAPSKQRTRYELLKWDYFTSTDIFETNNDQNVRPISGANAKDIKQVLDHAVHALTTKYPQFGFHRFISGYRRFDPRRGMDYMLDFTFTITGSGQAEEIRKRVHLIRPLNKVELIPVPYVTESTPIIIVLPVSLSDITDTLQFLDRYSKSSLDAEENARLILVLFYDSLKEQDSYKELIGEIDRLRKKYGFGESKATTSSKMNGLEYVYIRSRIPSPFLLMDLMLQTMGRDRVYLIGTPWMEVQSEFLNRVRMNTIKDFQVFFPIPFVQYNPKIAYRAKSGGIGSPPEHFIVHKNFGRFDRHDSSVASFYGSDYHSRRKSIAIDDNEHLYFNRDFLSVFVNSTLHVFRAVDPALKIRYYEKRCDSKSRQDLYAKCLASRKESLGTKAQLANLLFEHGAINDEL